MQLKGCFYALGQKAKRRKRISKWVKMTHVKALFAGGLRVKTT